MDDWIEFFGHGLLVLPIMLGVGTGSLDAVAVALVVLFVMMLGAMFANPDAPWRSPEDDN